MKRMKHYKSELDVLDHTQEDAMWEALYGNADKLRLCIAKAMETENRFKGALKKNQEPYTMGMYLHYNRIRKILTDLLLGITEITEKDGHNGRRP